MSSKFNFIKLFIFTAFLNFSVISSPALGMDKEDEKDSRVMIRSSNPSIRDLLLNTAASMIGSTGPYIGSVPFASEMTEMDPADMIGKLGLPTIFPSFAILEGLKAMKKFRKEVEEILCDSLKAKILKGEDVPLEEFSKLGFLNLRKLSFYFAVEDSSAESRGTSLAHLADSLLCTLTEDHEDSFILEEIATLYKSAKKKGVEVNQKNLGTTYLKLANTFLKASSTETDDDLCIETGLHYLKKAAKYGHKRAELFLSLPAICTLTFTMFLASLSEK